MEDTKTIEIFLESLDRLEVAWTRTTVADFAPVLSDVLVPPVIGAPLPIEELSLDPKIVAFDPTPAEIEAAQTGITFACMAIANYGTVVLRSRPDATEAASLYPTLHVAVLQGSDVVPDMNAAFDRLGPAIREHPHSVILATGPSATADMGALVKGAHGPKHIHVILIDEI